MLCRGTGWIRERSAHGNHMSEKSANRGFCHFSAPAKLYY
jgi:hypothetical protein